MSESVRILIDFSGFEKLLSDVIKEAPERIEKALYEEANIEMNESKQRCPVDSGTLRGSGTVHPPEREGDRFSVSLTYGGAASAYALAVHEHLSEHSPPSWIIAENNGDGVQWSVPGTGPKYLESVILESAPHMADRIAKRLKLDEVK